MNKVKIREKTMQLIYQMDISGVYDASQISMMDEDKDIIGEKQADDVLTAVKEHIADIDNLIRSNLDKWSFDRIGRTDLAIMRTAVAEMIYLDYIPRPVSINEAVELSKKYGDEKSYKFINSVLGKIEQSLENES